MDSIFCSSCGTLIAKDQSECPFCKMPIASSKIKDKSILESSDSPLSQEEFPERLFQSAASFPQKVEVQPVANVANIENREDSSKTQKETPIYINPSPSATEPIERLRLSETILLLLAGMVPFIGTIGLLIAAFAGNETKKNRKTLARGILIVQSIIVVLSIVLLVFMESFFFEESFLFWVLLWLLLFEKFS